MPERKLVKLLASVTLDSQYLKSNCLTFNKVGQGQGLFEVDGQIVWPLLDSKKSMSKIIGLPGVLQLEGHRKENKVKLLDFRIKGKAKGSTHQRGNWSKCWSKSPSSQYHKERKIKLFDFRGSRQGQGLFEGDGQIVWPLLDQGRRKQFFSGQANQLHNCVYRIKGDEWS